MPTTIAEAPIIFFPESTPLTGSKVFVTGHMPDREGRVTPRFPDDNVQAVRLQMTNVLGVLNQRRAIRHLITSATAGADLLAIEYAMDNGIKTHIYFPTADIDAFQQDFVSYGQWSNLWTDILARSKNNSDIVSLHLPYLIDDPSKLARRDCIAENMDLAVMNLNDHMVDLLKEEDFVVALWDGRPSDSARGTSHVMMAAAQRHGLEFRILRSSLPNRDNPAIDKFIAATRRSK